MSTYNFEFSFREIDNGKAIAYPRSSESSVYLPDSATWDEVLRFFATFLEGVGYTGVYHKLETLGAFYAPSSNS